MSMQLLTPMDLLNPDLEGLGRDPLLPCIDFSKTKPLRFVFPILLDGDLVLSTEHLGPSYLVSVLRRAGVECHIIEVSFEKDVAETVAEIANLRPDVVGFSLTTIGVDKITSFGRALKDALHTNAFILAGGPLATHLREKLLALDGWDFLDGLVVGEGELPILRFAEALATDRAFSDVPNFVFRKDGAVVATPLKAAPHDLDLIPEAARDQFELHQRRLPAVHQQRHRSAVRAIPAHDPMPPHHPHVARLGDRLGLNRRRFVGVGGAFRCRVQLGEQLVDFVAHEAG